MADSEETQGSLLERFPALKSIGERLWRRRIPYVAQVTQADCGAACLAMVLGYWGRQVALEEVHSAAGLTIHGITARGILEAGQRLGLVGRAAQVDIDELHLLDRGSILHWEFKHFVVFDRLRKDGVEVVDPAAGRRFVPMEQVRKSLTGVALLFTPSETFQTGTVARGPNRYGRLLAEHSPSLLRVGITSLLLQLFALALPSLMGSVVDRVVPSGDRALLGILALGMGTLILFQFFTSLVRAHLLLHLRTWMDARMTVGFLDHLVRLPFSFFQLRSAGDLMNRLNSNATVREILTAGVLSAVLDGTLVVIYLVLLFAGSWQMALLAMGLALLQILVLVFSRGRQRDLMTRNLEVSSSAQSYEVEMFTGIQTLKAMGLEDRAVQHWSNLYVDVLNVSLERGRLQAITEAFNSTLRMASPLVTLSVGTYLALDGSLSLGQMLALNALAGSFLTPIANLVSAGFQLQLVSSYLARVDDVLRATPEQGDNTPRRPHKLQGSIQLEQVSFRYGPRSPLVVQDITLELKAGQFVAIVGPSGAGKSTLAQLLLGLYLPTSGRVLYDGEDLSHLDLRAVRSRMGVVLQDSTFFTSSLRDNITLSNPELGMEHVQAAAKLAHIHDDILAMPMKYDTVLVDRGLSLSGGQRQRLALARALVHRPAVLLLDEATSALDAVTESQVQEALAGIQCTRVVIAHRLSTIRNADLVVVMDGGSVVEMGRHDELLQRGGAYARLINAQVEQKEPPLPQTG